MFFVAIPLLHLLFVLAPSEQPSRTWNLPRIDPASSPPKIRDEDKPALAAEGTVKLSRILGSWRRNRSSVERRINNLGTCQGAD